MLQKENSEMLSAIVKANEKYVSSFREKGNLRIPPVKRIAILTCMDARLDPAQFAGLIEGDAHIIRNAGGRASDDAIRSLIISYKLLATREWFVIHHTECGMSLFTDDVMRQLLSKSLKTATAGKDGWKNTEEDGGSEEANFMSFLTFRDAETSVIEDVRRIRNHPLVPKDIPIYGYIYDVKSGKLKEVEEAMRAGRAE